MPLGSAADLLAGALALHRQGAMAQAVAQYYAVLKVEPGNADAHYYLGLMACQEGRFADGAELAREAIANAPGHARARVLLGRALHALRRRDEAIVSLEHAITLAPDIAQAHSHLADILSDCGRMAEAIESYDRALALAPDTFDDWFNRGLALRAIGRREEALTSFDRAIAAKPDFAQAFLERGNVLWTLDRFDDALPDVDKAAAIEPNLAEAWHSRGNILSALKRSDEAFSSYDRALALKPDLAEGWLGRGNILRELKRYDEASAAYDRALALKSDLAAAWLGRGNILRERKRYDEAFAAYDRAVALKPDLAAAWLGRGNAFCALKRYQDARAAYDKAIALEPDFAEAWLGYGNVFREIKNYQEASAAFDRALKLKPDLAEAWFCRGCVFFELKQYGEALAVFDKALALNPDVEYLAELRLRTKQYICDWTNLRAETEQLLSMVRQGALATEPFTLLGLSSSSADQLQCAKRFGQDQPASSPIWRGEIYAHNRIRVAYLSADFHQHATAHLAAGLFEQHDRSRFEITGISFGVDDRSAMRRRVELAFDRFIDVRNKNEAEIAELLRQLEIDIAVDLMGFTRDNRMGIFARRPAPIQVNYLGYPGTTGADYIDYILADPTVIPEDQRAFYAERVVWLPDSYQINDSRRQVAQRVSARLECGLPESSFVFCCFNNSFKFTPDMFDLWMRLLKTEGRGVLWLLETNLRAVENLRREAEKRAVASHRLIFAPRLAPADHLTRLQHADLFLDTLPYNAHTTASDALWAGVPVLTCLGATFAGRVAASLLEAVGLDELITHSLEEYEALALNLSRDPSHLAVLRRGLGRSNRHAKPLFNTERTARHIEAAYGTMWKRYQQKQAPVAFAVERIN